MASEANAVGVGPTTGWTGIAERTLCQPPLIPLWYLPPYTDCVSSSDSEKQVNQGWGSDAKEAVTEAQGEADAQAEATQTPAAVEGAPDWGTPAAADWGAPDAEAAATPAKEGDAEARPSRPVEEEDKTMTLEEYHASKTNNLAELVGSTGPREANEGNADLFKDAQKLNKADGNESYFAGLAKVRAM